MYNLYHANLVSEKMKEVEKKSYDAWKVTDFKHDSLLKSFMKQLAFFKRPTKQHKQNNCVCTCKC